jgi:hypothetical protein
MTPALLRSSLNYFIREQKMKMILTTLTGLLLWSGAAFAESVCVSYWPWGACALWENYSTLSGSGGSTSGRGYDRIYFKNNCSRKMSSAIRYKSTSGNWQTGGWWTLAPGEKKFVATTKNSIFYVHAQTIDHEVNKLRWGGSDWRGRVRNSDLEGFRKVRSNPSSFVDYTYNFSCDGVNKYKSIALAWSQNGRYATRIRNRADDARQAALSACGSSCQLSTTKVRSGSYACMAVVGAGQSTARFASVRTNKRDAEYAALSDCTRGESGCTVLWSGCNN